MSTEDKAASFEKQYVHDVYEKIATHFNKTRYGVWNKVSEFVNSIPVDQTIADIGAGNGKNMKLRPDKFAGCDMSDGLVNICKENKLNVVKGDILDIPFDADSFDNTICIAVIHHLSTIERRKKAISELLRITKPDGKIMVQVWALEQDGKTGKEFKEQENIVNWTDKEKKEIYGRYYHVFKKNELEELLLLSQFDNVKIIESFYEAGNWGIIFQKIK